MIQSRQLLKSSSWYFASYVISTVGGLLSFPVWTRLLTVSQYGLLSLINAGLFFTAALSKCGMQKAATRFFAESGTGEQTRPSPVYYSTILIGVVLTASVIAVGGFLLLKIIGARAVGGIEPYTALELAAGVTFFQTLNTILMMFLSIEHRASTVAFWNVFNRYAAFGAALACVYWLARGVPGVMLGTLMVEGLMSVILVGLLIRERKLRIRSFSARFFRECLGFGVPLSLAELANVFLNLGDRYLVQAFLGTEAVGLYAAAYNVAGAVQQALSTPLTLALPPLLVETWRKNGSSGTRRFLATAMDQYLIFAVPCIAGLSFYSRSLIVVFASQQYLRGAVVMPYLALPLILYGANTIFSAGLFIANRSVALMWISIGSGITNILMNLILIPRLGIVGAGLSTLAAYSIAIALLILCSPAELRVSLNLIPLAKYVLAAGAMVLWLNANSTVAGSLGSAFEVVVVAAVIYWTLLAIATRSVRSAIFEFICLMGKSVRTASWKPLSGASRLLRITDES